MGSHLIENEFQSDKYPDTPRGLIPFKASDPMAQDLLWTYAQRRREVDPEFADDLEEALRLKGYERPKETTTESRERVRKSLEGLYRVGRARLRDAGKSPAELVIEAFDQWCGATSERGMRSETHEENEGDAFEKVYAAIDVLRSAHDDVASATDSTDLVRLRHDITALALDLAQAYGTISDAVPTPSHPVVRAARATLAAVSMDIRSIVAGEEPKELASTQAGYQLVDRGQTFDIMVLSERARQDKLFPPETNGKVHGLEVWHLILDEELGEVARAILQHRVALRKMRGAGIDVSPSSANRILHELVQVAASARACAEHDPAFSFLDMREDSHNPGDSPIRNLGGEAELEVIGEKMVAGTAPVSEDESDHVFEGFDGKPIDVSSLPTCTRCGAAKGIAAAMCSKTGYREPHSFESAKG